MAEPEVIEARKLSEGEQWRKVAEAFYAAEIATDAMRAKDWRDLSPADQRIEIDFVTGLRKHAREQFEALAPTDPA